MKDPPHDNPVTNQPKSPIAIIQEENGRSVDPNVTDVLSNDLPCRSCGYNLRGLMTNGKCPECGASVMDSLNENLLRYADFTLVRKLTKGINLTSGSLKWSLVTILAASIIYGILVISEAFTQLPLSNYIILFIARIILIPLYVLPILYPLGWWWATTPDPIDAPAMRRQRIVLRWTAIGFVFVVPLWISIFTYGFMTSVIGAASTGSYWFREITTHVFFIMVWFHLCAVNYFMRDVMSRCAPNATQAKFSKHIRSLSGNRKWIRNFSVVLLAFHWIGMIFHYWVFPMKGLPAGGVSFGSGIGYFWMLLLWVVTIGMLAYVIEPVRDEYLIAQGFHDDKLESNQS